TKGWNSILVKVAQQKGPWRLAVRLTETDGKPLPQGAITEADEGAMRAGTHASAAAAGEAKLGHGAIDTLRARAKDGKATAADMFHLGYLVYRLHAHDENDHPDREAFQKACDLDAK